MILREMALKSVRALVLAVCMLGMGAQYASAGTQQQDDATRKKEDEALRWFADLIKKNNGKAFCTAPGDDLPEEVGKVLQYMKDHHIRNDLNDAEAVDVLAKVYPCKETSAINTIIVEPRVRIKRSM